MADLVVFAGLVVFCLSPCVWVYCAIRDQRREHQAHLERCRQAREQWRG